MICKKCHNNIDLKLDGKSNQPFVYCSGCGVKYNRNLVEFKAYSIQAMNELKLYFKRNSFLFFRAETYNGDGQLHIRMVKIKTDTIDIKAAEGKNCLDLVFPYQKVGITQNFSYQADGTLYRDAPVLTYNGFSDYREKYSSPVVLTIGLKLDDDNRKDITKALGKHLNNSFGQVATVIEFITLQQQIQQCISTFEYIEPHPKQMIPDTSLKHNGGKTWL